MSQEQNQDGRISKRAAVLLGLAMLLASVGVQAAWTMTVYSNTSTVGVYAESYSIGDDLLVVSTDINVAKNGLPAAGTQSTPVEITDGLPAANTPIVQNHWVYTVVLQEKAVNTVASGNFTVALYVNGTLLDKIYLTQQTPQATKVEGATISYDLGASIPSDPLFVLKSTVTLPPSGPTINYTMDAYTNGFKGNSTGIFNTTNPTLNVSKGDTLKVTIRGSDGSTHNIRFTTLSGGGTVLAVSADVDLGQTATLSYTFSAAGTYYYDCQYHKGTMKGTINVA